MRKSSWLGLIVILIGVWIFVNQLPAGRQLLAHDWVWPMIFIVGGLFGLSGRTFSRSHWWPLFFIAYGVMDLLRNFNVVHTLTTVSSDTLFWALALVFLGLSMAWPSRLRRSRRRKAIEVISAGSGKKSWGPADKQGKGWHHLMGETVLGNQPWTLPRDASVFTGLGESRVNLVTANLMDGDYHLDVSGWLGSIRIVVPSTVSVDCTADLNIGEVNVLGHNHGGFVREVRAVDPDFDTATTRLILTCRLYIGQIDVVRV